MERKKKIKVVYKTNVHYHFQLNFLIHIYSSPLKGIVPYSTRTNIHHIGPKYLIIFINLI